MSIIGFLSQNPGHLLTGLLVGAISMVVYYVFNFYNNRKNYPPGPFPLPILGNLRQLKVNKHVHEIFHDIGKKYEKGIFTLYIGSEPQVIVTDPHLALEVLKKHQFAGRPQFPFLDMFLQPDSVDVIFSDFNKEWEVIRKVSHAAVRKYAVSEKLTFVVADVVDEVVKEMLEKDGVGNPIDMRHYLFLTMYTILATSAFGKKYSFDDPELKEWINAAEIQIRRNLEFILIGFVPILKYVLRGAMKDINETVKFQNDSHRKNYEAHMETFDGENIRDFMDALLLARKEAEAEEGSSILKYLKPLNLQNCVSDLFTAGSETSRSTLTWAFLLMANYPDKQKKIREEINQYIADDDVPNLGHRADCNYTAAFIAETLRFRYIVPSGLPHKATVDMELGGHMIKKGTTVVTVMTVGFHDKETWEDPEVFRPERFLDEKGTFSSRPNPLYTPFSAGRRSCPGEKLALADMFFIVARFFQKTKGYEFVLPDGPGSVDLAGNPNDTSGWVPYPYKIVLQQIKTQHNGL